MRHGDTACDILEASLQYVLDLKFHFFFTCKQIFQGNFIEQIINRKLNHFPQGPGTAVNRIST